MGIFLNSGFQGFLSSCKKVANNIQEYFEDGFLGKGWKIWEYTTGKYKLTIDSITVRETMLIYELLISKIRALKGSLIISQGNGKIKTVSNDHEFVFVTLEEDDMSFVADDFIRCQSASSGGLRSYWVKCIAVDNNVIKLALNDFGGMDIDGNLVTPEALPQVGDDIVQFGNATVTKRQSLIYIHCDEGGQPTIQLLNGVNSKDITSCTKVKIDDTGFYTENGELLNKTATGDIITHLKADGSGILSKGAIVWDDKGNMSLVGNIRARQYINEFESLKANSWDINDTFGGRVLNSNANTNLIWDMDSGSVLRLPTDASVPLGMTVKIVNLRQPPYSRQDLTFSSNIRVMNNLKIPGTGELSLNVDNRDIVVDFIGDYAEFTSMTYMEEGELVKGWYCTRYPNYRITTQLLTEE